METESEPSSEIEEEEIIEEEQEDEDSSIEVYETMDVLALPIRAKPLFHNNKEQVEEFPLSQSKDGMESTSILVGEGLFRVVKTTLHQDGVPRIDVQLVMDSELTSFQHIIEKPSPQQLGLAGGFGLLGIALMMMQSLTPIFLGFACVLIGLRFLPTHLEQHRLIFSSCGNSHEIQLQSFGSFIPCFRASMALVGPAMAEYMNNGTLNSADIDELHAQLQAPPPLPVIENASQEIPVLMPPTEIIPVDGVVTAPPETAEVSDEGEPIADPPAQEVQQPVGPPVAIPTPQEAPAAPLPPPLSPPVGPPAALAPTPIGPPAPMSPPAPMVPPAPLNPPAPLVPPAPLPPPIAPMPAPPSGLNQPIPLDMPMPEAPRVAVQATPDEEPLISQEEQDALLNELT